VVHLLPAAETERVPHPGVDTSLQNKKLKTAPALCQLLL